MRLLNVHIDDFGKISNFDMDFTNNPVIIAEENGWGKSTLAAFIRIMLYGFEGEGKKKFSERERVKYKPWNKGNYGGKIIFEVKGEEYELVRHFGDKEKDDTGSLTKLDTMLSCSEYELKNIGEQLFGLDMESFKKTVFVGQGETGVFGDSESIGDGIMAKIGNLTDATDDVYSYERVRDKLLSKSRELKSGFKLGVINELKNQKTELEKNINAGSSIKQSLASLEQMLGEENRLLNQYKKQALELDKEFTLSGKKEAFELENQKGQELQTERKRLEDTLEECRERIPGGMPSQQDIDLISEKAREAMQIRALQKEYQVRDREEKKVPNGVDAEKIDAIIEKLNKVEKQQGRLRDIEHEISSGRQRLEFANEQKKNIYEQKLRDEQNKYNMRVNEAKNRVKGQALALFLSAISLMVLAAISYVFISFLVAVTVAFISVVLFGAGIVRRIVGMDNVTKKIVFPENIEKPQYEEGAKEIEALKAESDRIALQNNEMIHQIEQFFELCDMEFDFSSAQQDLYRLRESIGRDNEHERKNLEYQKLGEQLSLLEHEIEEWFNKFGVKAEGDYLASLREVGRIVIRYAHFESDLENIIAKQKAWEDADKISDSDAFSSVRDMNQIEAERRLIGEQIAQSEKNIREYVGKLEALRERMDQVSDDEEQLAIISEKIDESSHKYDIILETVKYMEQAKARLSSRYTQPVSDAFKKYYGYILDGEYEKYTIDANMNITKSEYGERRSIASLSKGYQDLTYVSLRMALMDAMYKGEKPFVILDDPFVNLDTDKICKAKDFLSRISKDYQVIYFTCHESRA